MIIKNEEFSFSNTLEQVNSIISGQCRDKGLKFSCHTAGNIDEYYYGDEIKLRQVMINILGNAVKFTPQGGEITFLIEEGQRFGGKAVLKLIFRDTGIGMSKEFLPHLFDAFSQEDSSATSKYGSTGLGMPITKSIVELMNGHIEVESEKGKGTTFTVTVTLGESERHAGMLEGDVNPKELDVLVVDDDPIALEHAQIVLGQAGICCELAASGAEALEKVRLRHARRDDYDLLLVDWKMPEMDGLEATRQIRASGREDAQTIPIIALTANAFDEDVQRSMQAGLNAHLSKPVEPNALFDTLEKMIRP